MKTEKIIAAIFIILMMVYGSTTAIYSTKVTAEFAYGTGTQDLEGFGSML